MCTHICANSDTRVHTHTYTYRHTCRYTPTHKCTHKHSTLTYICVYTYSHGPNINTHVHVHTHYTHTLPCTEPATLPVPGLGLQGSPAGCEQSRKFVSHTRLQAEPKARDSYFPPGQGQAHTFRLKAGQAHMLLDLGVRNSLRKQITRTHRHEHAQGHLSRVEPSMLEDGGQARAAGTPEPAHPAPCSISWQCSICTWQKIRRKEPRNGGMERITPKIRHSG